MTREYNLHLSQVLYTDNITTYLIYELAIEQSKEKKLLSIIIT